MSQVSPEQHPSIAANLTDTFGFALVSCIGRDRTLSVIMRGGDASEAKNGRELPKERNAP
jgi:hypothetical protein